MPSSQQRTSTPRNKYSQGNEWMAGKPVDTIAQPSTTPLFVSASHPGLSQESNRHRILPRQRITRHLCRRMFPSSDEEVVSWKGERGKWKVILGIQKCAPTQRHAWKLETPTWKVISHVRLNIYTDREIARFRFYSKTKSPTKTPIPCLIFDEYFDISIQYRSRSNTTCVCYIIVTV
jgi:hypothetical protein